VASPPPDALPETTAARSGGRRPVASPDPTGAAASATPEALLAALTAEGGPLLAGLPAPVRADGIELLGAMAGSGHRRAPGLVRRADGQTLQLTSLLYAVLEEVDGRRTYADIAASLSSRLGRDVTAADVGFLAEAKLRPLGVLRTEDGEPPPAPTANPLLGLRCKVVVTDPQRTRRLTAPFARLFHPLIVTTVLTAFALITGWLAFDKGLASATHQAFYSPELLLLVFGLTVVSAGFHEFGHAAACRYGGATPGAMGAGLYLVWPAFFTDVSDSYRLGRAGRLRVDLGGLYFNAVFAVGTFAVWSLLGWDALLLVIGTQILQMLRQLTPLVRFDGYHILADLTGVPDLFAHIKPTLLGLLPHRWGRPEHRVLRPWARAVVTLWVLTVVPVLAGLLVLMVRVLPRLAATAWDSFGLHWDQLVANWLAQDAARVGVGLLALLALLLPVASITYLLLRIGRRFARWAWRASAGSRPRRGAVVVGAILLLGGIGWLWAADAGGPIDGGEGGTLADAFAALLPPVADSEHDEEERVVGADPWAVRAAVDGTARGRVLTGNRTVAAAGGSGAAVDAAPASGAVGAAGGRRGDEAARGRGDDDRDRGDEGRADDGRGGGAREHGGRPADPGPPDVGSRDPWPFPFDPPGGTAAGGNRAFAVNTTDGRTVQDVALSLVRVADGPVHHRNEAWALAQCRDCHTVAVAFQVVLLETDDLRVVAPVNHSVAYNEGCERCTTHSVAVQLVVTLTAAPSSDVLGQLQAAMGRLQHLQGRAAQLPLARVHAELVGTKAEVLGILAREAPDAEVREEVELEAGEGPDDAIPDLDGLDGLEGLRGGDDLDGSDDLDGHVAAPGGAAGDEGRQDDAHPGDAKPDAGADDGDPDPVPDVDAREGSPAELPGAVEADAEDTTAGTDAGPTAPATTTVTSDDPAGAQPTSEQDEAPEPDAVQVLAGGDVAIVHEDDGALADAGKPPVDADDVEPAPDPDEEATG
jgi:putative peptide zinc metalloprotease protein